MYLIMVLYMTIEMVCGINDITSNTKIRDSTKTKNLDMPDNLQDYDDYRNKTFSQSSLNKTGLENFDAGKYRRHDSYSDLDLPVKEKYAEVLRGKKSGEADDGAIADKDDNIVTKRYGKINNARKRERDVMIGNMDTKNERRKNDATAKPVVDTPDPNDTKSRLHNLFDRYKITIEDSQAVKVANFNKSAGNRSLAEWALSEPEMMEQWSGSGEAQMRAGPGRSHGKHIPSAIELDMAPARGGAVHTLRVKNRLCFRHVMIPEGPKYDSRGKLYLGEFERTKGKEYTETAPPKLLLPKCCNCCRKSVLGCE